MEGQPQGKDGKPGKYKYIKMEKPELYDLSKDPFEKNDIASSHRTIMSKMQKMAEGIRDQLGDDLTGKKGTENRLPGRIE